MNGSLRIATAAGIGVYVHWTFLLLLGWIAFEHASTGGWSAGIEGVLFTLSLFACVVLHEFGHALAARMYGIPTRDITLLPIGGVARLERMPEEPLQEFVVAIAGPAVNVVIAAILTLVLLVGGGLSLVSEVSLVGGSFVAKLLVVNLVLIIFNLLPAFPMDGGRVLRAILGSFMSHVQATIIAASVGQVMAVVFAVIALFSHQWMLLFVALFVYLGAQGESQDVQMRAVLRGARVRDAMVTRFLTLDPRDLLTRAASEAMAGHQKDFPVITGNEVQGLLLNRDLMRALADGDAEQRTVDSVMRTQCPVVTEDLPLHEAVDRMRSGECPALLVARQGRLVGILTNEHLGDWMMLHSAMRQNTRSPSRTEEFDGVA